MSSIPKATLKCKLCKKRKIRSDFPYKNRRCQKCSTARDKSEKRKAYFQKYQKEYVKRNAHKVLARLAVMKAVREGRLKRKPCVECGDLQSRGHHPDYSKPLKVVWLCQKHHQRLHAKLLKAL